jgi:hypothetical protein
MKQTIIGALGVALIALGASGIAWSDHDRDDDRPAYRGALTQSGGTGPQWAQAQGRYQTECGGCHLAYPPGLLPTAAWGHVMGTLADHFGDDASLDPATAANLLAHLQAGAADSNPWGRPGAALPTQVGEGPPRITQTRYFLRQHDEVPARLVRDNAQIRSFSNCQACHRGAEQGRFDEDEVAIPGVGKWED